MTASRLDILARLEAVASDWDWSGILDYCDLAGLVVDIPNPGDEDPLMTDYTDPSTIDVDEVMANIDNSFRIRGHQWSDALTWPNITVKALTDEVRRLRAVVDAGTTGTTPETGELPDPAPDWGLKASDIDLLAVLKAGSNVTYPDRWFGEWRDRPAGYDQWRITGDEVWVTNMSAPFGPRSIVEARPVPQATPRWTNDGSRIKDPDGGYFSSVRSTPEAEWVAAALNAHGKETDQ